MDENIVLESLVFAINKLQIEFMLKGRLEDSIDRYVKLKSAYKTLRNKGKYDKEGYLIALCLFKEHLENLNNTDNEFKELFLDRIKDIQYQIDMLN